MLYKDVLHPLNVTWLAYDMLCVVVRSFSPETLVRKRPKRGSGATERRHRHRHLQPPHREESFRRRSPDLSRLASHDTSLQFATSVGSSQRPPVPPAPPRPSATTADSRPPSRAGSRSHSRTSSRGGANREADGLSGVWQLKLFFEQFRSWRTIDVTQQTLLLSHVLRATPVAVLHFFTQLRTDVATLELLRFGDLSKSAANLLIFEEDAVFEPDFFWRFTIVRCLLCVVQQYVLGRVCLETNFVVNRLRSRRTYRHVIGWATRLLSHALTDPITCSVVSSTLLCTLEDFSPVTGPLRYTPAGLCAAALTGLVGVVLEQLVLPTAAICFQRAVVHVYEGLEYMFTRRYATQSIVAGEATDGCAPASGLGNTTVGGDSESSQQDTAHEMEGMKEHPQSRRESQLVSERARLAVFRAIICRVTGSLFAQCVVQHPLTVLCRMLYSRAVLHAVGLLEPYTNAPAKPLSWSDFAIFLNPSAYNRSSGVPILEALRCIGRFVGGEISQIRSSILKCSVQEAAIEELLQQAGRRQKDGGGGAAVGFVGSVSSASALESMELMARCVAATSPLFNMVHLTSVNKLLSFYMDMWVRLRGE